MAANEGFVTTDDGVRLFVQQMGSGGRTVVILNSTYMYEEFKYLAEDRAVIFYDLRNRGRSDSVNDGSKLRGGVHNDVDDLETIRRHFNLDSMDVIGHSYLGMVVGLYAMKHPSRANRVVQIGASAPDRRKQYPAHLTGADATMTEVNAKLAELQKEATSTEPQEFGRKMWALMRLLYVTDPADADKILWDVAHLPNESFTRLMANYSQYLLPSFQGMKLTDEDFARVKTPVLVVHGTRDRQCPYGGARDWAVRWPNARLVTIENAAHLAWIESPNKVFGSVKTFLDGAWPDAAELVTA